MTKAEIIAYHGWGFDSNCWNQWNSIIPEEILIRNFDRGYFKSPKNPEFEESLRARILFTHSFGLHMCDDIILNEADLLVIFGGFLSFHPRAARFRRRSRLILNQMLNRFRENPQQVLKNFYSNAFHPQQPWETPGKELDKDLLLEDLQLLNKNEIRTDKLKKTGKICILHGFQDGVVTKAKGRELFSRLQTRAKYFEIKDAGHALPFTHVEQCWSFIQPEINELISFTNIR